MSQAVLQQAEIALANLICYQSSGSTPSIHEFGHARRTLESVRAAIASSAPAEPVNGVTASFDDGFLVGWEGSIPDGTFALTKVADMQGLSEIIAQPAAPVVPASEPVYLVATGHQLDGQETYTRHDSRPPMCDAEKLYTHPAQAVAVPSIPSPMALYGVVLKDRTGIEFVINPTDPRAYLGTPVYAPTAPEGQS
jgi:hypothetical protein